MSYCRFFNEGVDMRVQRFTQKNVGQYFAQVRDLVESAGMDTTYLDMAEPMWLAFEGEKIVGCVGVELSDIGGNMHLQSLVVQKDCRRRGIGTALVTAAQEYVIANGLSGLVALTLFWNIAFYKSLGFTKIDAKAIKASDSIAARKKHKYCTALRWSFGTEVSL